MTGEFLNKDIWLIAINSKELAHHPWYSPLIEDGDKSGDGALIVARS
jgi:hypothetical protein